MGEGGQPFYHTSTAEMGKESNNGKNELVKTMSIS
jgi:hypothetical protein